MEFLPILETLKYRLASHPSVLASTCSVWYRELSNVSGDSHNLSEKNIQGELNDVQVPLRQYD